MPKYKEHKRKDFYENSKRSLYFCKNIHRYNRRTMLWRRYRCFVTMKRSKNAGSGLMPDVHPGKAGTIGFTSTIAKKGAPQVLLGSIWDAVSPLPG